MAVSNPSEQDEATPLLPPPSPPKPAKHPHVFRVVFLCVLSIFLIEIGDFMQRAPWTRILEDIVCREHFSTHSKIRRWEPEIPEQDCKVAPVQARVAMLKGWDLSFSCIPAIFLAVPYGALADRVGRKTVLLVALFGIVLANWWTMGVAHFRGAVDIRIFWLGNVFLLIGGGSAVAISMFFTTIADVVPESQRAFAFFQITAATLVATVAGVPLAYWLMKTSVWLPMYIGGLVVIFGSFFIFLLPETLDRAQVHRPSSHNQEQERLISPSAVEHEEDDEGAPVSFSKKGLRGMMLRIEESRFVFKSPLLCALAFTFLVRRLDRDSVQLLFQLASKRFNWSLGESSFLIPLTSIVNFALLIFILPAIYAVLAKKTSLAPTTRDLVVARGSVLFFIVGSLGLAFADVPWLLILSTTIFSLGSGFSGAVRSLLTSLIDTSQISRLYAVLAVVETIGALVAAPTMSKVFSRGLEIGGTWMGMAFLVVGGVYVVVGVGIWCVRVDGRGEEVEGRGEDE